VTPDETVIYFAHLSSSGSSGKWDLEGASQQRNESVGPPELVPELSALVEQAPTWVSPDECELYLNATPIRNGLEFFAPDVLGDQTRARLATPSPLDPSRLRRHETTSAKLLSTEIGEA